MCAFSSRLLRASTVPRVLCQPRASPHREAEIATGGVVEGADTYPAHHESGRSLGIPTHQVCSLVPKLGETTPTLPRSWPISRVPRCRGPRQTMRSPASMPRSLLAHHLRRDSRRQMRRCAFRRARFGERLARSAAAAAAAWFVACGADDNKLPSR